MRWLMVAQDGWGLGHVSRQLGLARELRRRAPRDEFLFLTYSDATHLIAAERFASVKLPAPEWFRRPEDHHIDDRRRLQVAIAVVRATAASYRPDAVVLDTFPVGNRGEFALFRQLDCRRFLIAREVRDPLPHWEYHESLPRFHALLAPYAEGEVSLPAPEGVPLHWVGPILVRHRGDLLSRAAARARLGLPREGRICLVSFGGGGNPAYPRLEAWALELAAAYPGWHFAFARPPLLHGAGADLGLPNAARVAYYPMAECYAAFDAALSTVGSSAYELACMGLPAILVPDVSPQKDEDFVAKARRVLGEAGGFVVKAFDREGLAAAFAAMDDPRRLAAMTAAHAAQKPPNGAVKAATILMQQVSHLRGKETWRESS